ncbi:hypothetical protein L226DRAFT_277659 [Lentinus tigrinus ALCF2SS1-7]|nr:hypothetical protein L226DRAFT_277659 [Lentinus tigrinus ALCF2SS1-7]
MEIPMLNIARPLASLSNLRILKIHLDFPGAPTNIQGERLFSTTAHSRPSFRTTCLQPQRHLTWTTRFMIAAAADGSNTPPAHDTQPDGQKIP